MYDVQFRDKAFDQYVDWLKNDKVIFNKITTLLNEVRRTPFTGTAKPEPLTGNHSGHWSRRITKEHRLVYEVNGNTIIVYSCEGHYDD